MERQKLLIKTSITILLLKKAIFHTSWEIVKHLIVKTFKDQFHYKSKEMPAQKIRPLPYTADEEISMIL